MVNEDKVGGRSDSLWTCYTLNGVTPQYEVIGPKELSASYGWGSSSRYIYANNGAVGLLLCASSRMVTLLIPKFLCHTRI